MFLKPQDLIFLFILILLLLKRDSKLLALAGIISLAFSIPLYFKWIFFTAQKLVFYSFIFFIIAGLIEAISIKFDKK